MVCCFSDPGRRGMHLRRVQGDPGQVAALRALVLDSERVQFGGRDVSEDDFQSHVAAVRPIIAGGKA